ncbi:phosphorylase family protein [Methylocaldum sp. MU1018]
MKSIGFIVALPAEARTLVRRRAGFDCLLQLPEGHWLTVSGTGPNHAQIAASRLLERNVEALVSWGCAAALDPALRAGDLALPERIVTPEDVEHAVCPDWHERVRQALAPALSVAAGPLLGSPEIIASSAEKRMLHSAKGAIAVDMESAAVAAAARARGVPFLAIRAIADPAGMTLPRSVAVAVDERGDVSLSKLLKYASRHPGEFVALARLGKAFDAAANTLRRTARLLGPDFRLSPPTTGG